jgi:PAS domain S-box-containing protein
MLDVNKAACERLGYTKDEILVMGITPFMPPEKKAAFRQNISKIMGNGFTTLESSNTARSGKTIPVEVTARRIRYRGVDAVLSFSKDISERKRLEWEMRNRLEALYYHAMHIWSLSSIEDVVECFGVIEGILGFSEGAIGFVDGDKIVFRYYGEVSSKALHTIPLGGRGITARAVRTGETQFVNDTRLDPDYLEGAKPSLSELDVPLKFGSKVIAVINIEDSKPNAFKEEDKRLVEIVGQQLAQAITRIEQEKTIQASEDDYRKLADSSLDMVALITGTKIVYVNDNAAKLLGYDHSSILIGRDISNAIAPEDRRTIAERALKRQRGEEVPTRYELRLAKRSGETLIVDATMSSINYGGTPATLIFGKNVTESRQFERNVEALHGRFMRLATANNMEELSAQVLDVITATMNCWKVCFFTLRDGELELIGEKRTTQALGCQSRDEAAKRVALFGESVNISNIRNEHADRTCLHSQIAAPVKIDGVTCAVLEAESDRVDAFKDSDLRILEMLATHVGFPLGRIYCVKVDVRAHQ